MSGYEGPRGNIYQSILETIGGTPLVRCQRIEQTHALDVQLLAKLEYFNPMASVKDRIGQHMLQQLEQDGVIGPKTHIIEPTSGNTGIGLALACAATGRPITLVMPEHMSEERRKMMKLLGANLVLTPAQKGMTGAIERAKSLVEELDDAHMPQQFENPANPSIHELTTGPEIWMDRDEQVDVLVAGVGTGGSLTGAARYLKARKSIHVVAVEPEDSPVLSGGKPGPHRIEGIGAGFVPAIYDDGLVDEIITYLQPDRHGYEPASGAD
jgi:Cysteine synthase